MKRNSPTSSPRYRSGFTLTEVLLVLAILGVIAAMVIPNLLGQQANALIRQTKINIAGFENIAKNYAIDHAGEWPSDVNSMMNPGSDQDGRPLPPYLEKVPKDAWGLELHYEYPTSKPVSVGKPAIWSNGPNKTNEEGSNDDVSNWDKR